MVQMKESEQTPSETGGGGFISHMVQMKVKKYGEYLIRVEVLYIPHGSDERCYTDYNANLIGALYPTWFR